MSERRKAEKAAEQVRKFLYVRSGMPGYDPQEIYSLGDPDNDGRPIALTVADLTALVVQTLGPDVELVNAERVTRARRRRRDLPNDIDLLAGLRRELDDAPDTDAED